MLVLSCSFAVNCPTSQSCGAVADGTAEADQITSLLDVTCIFDFLHALQHVIFVPMFVPYTRVRGQ